MSKYPTVRGRRLNGSQRSFTLAELLISLSIMGILASASLFALFGVMEDAKEARTRAQIARLNELLLDRWDGYTSRPVPVVITPGTSPLAAARLRLVGLRELMRMELPDRKTDLTDQAVVLRQPNAPPGTPLNVALWRTYERRARTMLAAAVAPASLPSPWHDAWTAEQQGAECLYLILASMQDGDTNGLSYFRESEIGDVDGDGIPEIIDGWGNPIRFIRWAPGYLTYSDIQQRNSDTSPDPFDPLKVDVRWSATDGDPTNDPFALYPLVISAGRDGVFDIVIGNSSTPIHYSSPPPAPSGCPANQINDPYLCFDLSSVSPAQMGLEVDDDNDGLNNGDNISNHLLGAN